MLGYVGETLSSSTSDLEEQVRKLTIANTDLQGAVQYWRTFQRQTATRLQTLEREVRKLNKDHCTGVS